MSERVAALSLQGPTSRDVLKQCSDADMKALKYFQTTAVSIGGAEVRISRTGYAGDLGYEPKVSTAEGLERLRKHLSGIAE